MRLALGLLVAVQLMGAPAVPASMENVEQPEVVITAFEEKEPTRSEQFCWYYRVKDGVLQKRLWSITYACWVTDWMDCD